MSARAERAPVAAEHDIVLTRRYAAPRAAVFEAWTNPEQLKRWWAPANCTTPYCTVDLRRGGKFHYCMRMADGKEIWGMGIYREIVVPERIVFTDTFADEAGNPVPPAHHGMSDDHPNETRVTITFTEHEGETTVTLHHALGRAFKERDAMQQGWTEMLDRLGMDVVDGERTMDMAIDPAIPADLREAVITRTFDAPRELVWRMWTEPEHIRAWWGPHGFDGPHPSVDLRVGGKMNFDMRAPDGSVTPIDATIRELEPPERLVIDQDAMFGSVRFVIRDEVTLADDGGRTRVTVRAIVLEAPAEMLPGLKGQVAGWNESFDKMAEHLDLLRWTRAAGASRDGTSFILPDNEPVVVVSRTFDAPRELVWRALTDPAMRARWWGPAKYVNDVIELDVKPGGKWRIDQRAADGKVYSFWGEFRQVRPPQRLVETFCFADEPPVVETITLAERDGRTTLTNVGRSISVAGRNAAVSSGMEGGARESMDRLAALLKAVSARGN